MSVLPRYRRGQSELGPCSLPRRLPVAGDWRHGGGLGAGASERETEGRWRNARAEWHVSLDWKHLYLLSLPLGLPSPEGGTGQGAEAARGWVGLEGTQKGGAEASKSTSERGPLLQALLRPLLGGSWRRLDEGLARRH